jgi:hypothetical protein
MNRHFSSFTPEAMRAFGQELADGAQRRTEVLNDTRNRTVAMLAAFRTEHRDAEASRRQRAGRDADARRLFVSELRSGVHALMGRFDLSRKETAGDLQEMAHELRAARHAFLNRPGRQGGVFRGRGKHPRQPQPSASGQPIQAAAESNDGQPNAPLSGSGDKAERSKKRHG